MEIHPARLADGAGTRIEGHARSKLAFGDWVLCGASVSTAPAARLRADDARGMPTAKPFDASVDILEACTDPAGIFSGIFSDVFTPDEIFDLLGDKVILALGDAVEGAREDYRLYRTTFPGFAATDAARVRFGWIHDRIWNRVKNDLDDRPEVSFVDQDPTHDMWVGSEFRFRFKRHSLTGAIRAYPTAAALDFIAQGVDLFGVSTVNLTAGYEWLPDVQEMGDPVLSLRDGSFDEVLWMVNLPTTGTLSGGIVAPIIPPTDGPTAPIIDVPSLDNAGDAEEASDS